MNENQPNSQELQIGQDPLRLDTFSGPTVQEVHIDFLLEEEFNVDPTFLRRFIVAAGQSDGSFQTERVEHSVSDQCGEADLIVVYKQLEGKCEKIAILIEDKIRAVFQPRQADRYRERGESGNKVHWDRYWTCLVAPASYIKKADHGFDAAVSLEQLKEWFAIMDPKRCEFKARVIDQAIKKAERTGVQKVDLAVTTFRERYYAVFEEFFADQRKDVHMRSPGPTWSGDTWFEIRSTFLPKGAYINHKSPAGCVDLTFPNTNAALLRIVEPCLEQGMGIEQDLQKRGNPAQGQQNRPIQRF
jgi:hypothetical protein